MYFTLYSLHGKVIFDHMHFEPFEIYGIHKEVLKIEFKIWIYSYF